jgi:hypothetical protein
MEYKKSSILLKKIHSLHQTLMESEDHPSSIEKQLMKSYLRDFYDCFVDGNGDTDIFAEVEPQPALEKETIPVITPPVIEETVVNPQNIETTKTSEEISINNSVVEDIPNEVISPIPQQKIIEEIPEAITDKEVVVEPQEIIEQMVTDPVDQDLMALFSENPVVDLSDKLAMRPVTDLTKAFSINERYFTIQELFGGDADQFQQTLQQLNGLSSFKEASQTLIQNVAAKYEWSAETKKKKAENFIKLVRRRYQ